MAAQQSAGGSRDVMETHLRRRASSRWPTPVSGVIVGWEPKARSHSTRARGTQQDLGQDCLGFPRQKRQNPNGTWSSSPVSIKAALLVTRPVAVRPGSPGPAQLRGDAAVTPHVEPKGPLTRTFTRFHTWASLRNFHLVFYGVWKCVSCVSTLGRRSSLFLHAEFP